MVVNYLNLYKICLNVCGKIKNYSELCKIIYQCHCQKLIVIIQPRASIFW